MRYQIDSQTLCRRKCWLAFYLHLDEHTYVFCPSALIAISSVQYIAKRIFRFVFLQRSKTTRHVASLPSFIRRHEMFLTFGFIHKLFYYFFFLLESTRIRIWRFIRWIALFGRSVHRNRNAKWRNCIIVFFFSFICRMIFQWHQSRFGTVSARMQSSYSHMRVSRVFLRIWERYFYWAGWRTGKMIRNTCRSV